LNPTDVDFTDMAFPGITNSSHSLKNAPQCLENHSVRNEDVVAFEEGRCDI
jgi:hypothetical protein